MHPLVEQVLAVLAEVVAEVHTLVLLVLVVLVVFYFTTKIRINNYGYICSY
jgi:hypothetical protein